MMADDGFDRMGEIDAKHRAEMGAGYIIPKSKSRAGYLSIQLKPFDKIKPVLSSRYLVKGWLDRGAFSVVYGESNVGKTFFALDLAMQVAAGKDWHGNKVKDWQSCPGPVVYVAGEGGAEINNRIEAMRRNNPAVAKHIEDNTEFCCCSPHWTFAPVRTRNTLLKLCQRQTGPSRPLS
jgi:hypothetical protein